MLRGNESFLSLLFACVPVPGAVGGEGAWAECGGAKVSNWNSWKAI
jgi:hypothetical protein